MRTHSNAQWASGRWPEWARVATACAATDLRPRRMYDILKESGGAIRTCLLKSPGAARGARLVHLGDLFKYIAAAAEQQQGKARELCETNTSV
jgi:hypothetical protein